MPTLSVSLTDAETYFSSRLRSAAWNDADDAAKEQALAQAATFLSGAFVFYSVAWSTVDGAVVWNWRIVAAVCEEAIWLMEHDPAALPDALFNGIAQASAGAVSATFSREFVCPWVCAAARLLVGDLGAYVGEDGASVRTTPLAM